MNEDSIVNLSGNTSDGPIPGVTPLNQTIVNPNSQSIQDLVREQANNFAAAQVVQPTTTTTSVSISQDNLINVPVDRMQVTVDEYKEMIHPNVTTEVSTVTTLNSSENQNITIVNPNEITNTTATSNTVIIEPDNNITINSGVSGVQISGVNNTTSDVSISNEISTQQELSTESVETEKTTSNFVLSNKFIVNLGILKAMVVKAKKAAICNPNGLMTQLLDITFDNDYLKIVATDEDNVLIQENKNIGFTDSLHFSVAAELFTNLISKLNCETVEFVLGDNRYITLITDDGSTLSIPENYERNTGSSYVLERESGKILPTDTVIDIDGAKFKELIQKSKSLCGDPTNDSISYLSGVYCSEKVYATNTESMLGVPNLPQLQGYTFYLPDKFVKLFLELNFNENSKIILRSTDNNVISHVIIKDDQMELEGPCDTVNLNNYPIEFLKDFIDTSYSSKFVVSKSRLEDVLKISNLFISPTIDKETCIFRVDIKNNMLYIDSVNKQARQGIPIEGITSDMSPFNIRIKDCLEVLSNCTSEKLAIEVDTERYRNIRIVDNDFVLINAITNV